MIYITGDVHGGIDIRKLLDIKFEATIKPEDYLIICGDFGFIWNYKKQDRKEKQWLDWFSKRKYTTLFVDGNHECFPRLNTFPVKEWNGGKVHEIKPNLLHLMRGQVFTIEGETYFTMGGAASHDRGPAVGNTKSVIGKGWWPEEIPNEEERNEGLENLKKYNNKVDYIITHCLPTNEQEELKHGQFKADDITNYLEDIKKNISYTHWYCGHYHVNKDLQNNISVVFNQILMVGETVAASKPILGSPIFKKGDKICFNHDGKCESGVVVGIYPWGRMKVKDQALYDILLEDNLTTIKYIPETETYGYSCI